MKGWIILSLALLSLVGCGTVGPPVAPEDIGVEAKLRREKLEKERREKEAPQAEKVPEEKAEEGVSLEQVPSPSVRPGGSGDVLIRPR
ncbi:MAG: hypothetical protein C4293_01025 [Nitrospiraceae bacterium]